MPRCPAVFVSHGAPTVALERDDYTDALGRFGASLPALEAVVVVSAHWEAPAPLRVNAHPRPPVIYDFFGFPDALYRLTYAAPGAPGLAREIAALLAAEGRDSALEETRGWDHGLWVPLRLVLPDARVPVVEVSLPVPRSPSDLLAVGRALAPLRERGVLLVGSGGAVHNLRRLRFEDERAPVEGWAAAFDAWVRDRVAAGDVQALAAYADAAPHADLAVPTSEHFDPLFVVLGAGQPGEPARPIYEGFRFGSLSMRSFALGS